MRPDEFCELKLTHTWKTRTLTIRTSELSRDAVLFRRGRRVSVSTKWLIWLIVSTDTNQLGSMRKLRVHILDSHYIKYSVFVNLVRAAGCTSRMNWNTFQGKKSLELTEKHYSLEGCTQ